MELVKVLRVGVDQTDNNPADMEPLSYSTSNLSTADGQSPSFCRGFCFGQWERRGVALSQDAVVILQASMKWADVGPLKALRREVVFG